METKQPSKPKAVWLAVLLNCFPLVMGLGYIYIGKWLRFAVVFGIQLFSLIPMTAWGLREYNPYLLAILWIVSLFDVYSQAKEYNKQLASPSS